MQVKNIRTFRDFYKSNIKRTLDSDRNPHFAGEEKIIDGKTTFGLFEMFNGPGDIENKLTTILNIAGDSQAIYEFMQNAVDADSNNFFLAKYGTSENPYLIVLNDGKYFDLQAVISILSIGASSKYRNPDNIGQFGVGFKLAHRLIGADNSIHELLEENKGPILFSWSDGELTDLPSIEQISVVDPELKGSGKSAVSTSMAPWLFKIVATNFPCQHDDLVWDAKGRMANGLLTDEDIIALKGAAQQCLIQIKSCSDFKTGTLLVIPLHAKKVEHVIGKVPKGLEIAATIISRRVKKSHDIRTQIEDEELQPEHLYTEHWELSNEEIVGRLGNEQVKIAELMLLYCNPLLSNPFKGKPKFYRYFPMSLEQHGFRFAIHGNALTVSAARTELQENDSNKFLLGKLVPLVNEKLKTYVTNDPNRFCHLYLSLLLSHKGEGNSRDWIQGRNWLEDALWLGFTEVLRKNIPIRRGSAFVTAPHSETILIKNSKLPVEKWYRKGTVEWFYWGQIEQFSVCLEAQSEEKLALNTVNILDVLSDANCIGPINNWLAEAPENAHAFLSELNEATLGTSEKTLIWKHFSQLELWVFPSGRYSIESLSSTPDAKHCIINYGPINQIAALLSKVGIQATELHLDQFDKIERSIRETNQKALPYLFNYEELNKLLSSFFIKTKELTSKDKRDIFSAIEAAVKASANTAAKRIETMKTIALFSNKVEGVKPLYSLTSLSSVPQMLQGWRIKEGEAVEVNLKEYLSDSKELIYENILKPYWIEIASQHEQTDQERKQLFEYTKECYKLKTSLGSLDSNEISFSTSGARTKVFYHPSLHDIHDHDYSVLANVLKLIEVSLPQYTLLPFYKEPPFLLPVSANIELSNLTMPLSFAAAKVFVRWLKIVFPEAVRDRLFHASDNDTILITPKQNGIVNYYSNNSLVHELINDHFKESFVQLPDFIKTELNDSILFGDKLLERLIFEAKGNNEVTNQLVDILLSDANDDTIKKFIENIPTIDVTAPIAQDSLIHKILTLCFSVRTESAKKEILGQLLILNVDGEWRKLKDIKNRGSDLIYLPEMDAPLSVNQLLGGASNQVNHLLRTCAGTFVHLNLGNYEQISQALGINVEANLEDIWQEFAKRISSTPKIDNGHQLAFICGMRRKRSEIANHGLQIETLDGWHKLKGTFYVSQLSFIPTRMVLKSGYSTIREVMQISNIVIESLDWSLLNAPFLKSGDLQMPGVDNVIDTQQQEFGAYLFKLWVCADRPERITIRNPSQKMQNILGFNPEHLVVNGNYSLVEEQPRSDLSHSYNGEQIEVNDFLVSMGAQSDNSAVVKTRKYLKKDKDGEVNIDGMTVPQKINTLRWLSLNKVPIESRDALRFYRNLAGKANALCYFPASIANSSFDFIVDINDGAFLIGKEQLEKARDLNLSLELSEVSEVVNKPIVNLATLQDWTHHLLKTLKLVTITWHAPNWDIIEHEAEEWNFPFYLEWKKRYNYLTINCLHSDKLPKWIIINGNNIKPHLHGHVEPGVNKNVVFVDSSNFEQIADIMDSKNIFDQAARSYLRQCYKAQSELFAKYLDLAKKDSGFAQLLEQHAQAIQLQEERREKAEVVKNAENEYSLKWFLNLLEFVRVQERSASVPEVAFTKCEQVPTAQKTFELTGCVGRIPANIDTFDEIPAVITYRKDSGELTKANTKLVASEKHQKLWVMFPEVSVQDLLSNVDRIVEVRLTFIRTVDLIDELKAGYNNLKQSYHLTDDTNLKNTLSPNIDFIFGPPGTGKTTALADRIIERREEGIQGPVIVLTPTNKAADVLAKKIISRNNGVPDWLIRAGTCTDPYLLEQKMLKNGTDLFVDQSSNSVFITTIHRFPYFTVPVSRSSNDRARLCDCPWSQIIFDEASMIPLVYITHAIQRCQQNANPPHFVVAGDPLQIPPVFDLQTEELDDYVEQLQQANIYTMIGLNSFDVLAQQQIPVYGNRIDNLDVQYRSIPTIGNLISKFSYGGEDKIENARGVRPNTKPISARPLPVKFAELGIKPITIIRYPVKAGDSIFRPQKLDDSPLHLYSALLVNELVRFFRKETIDAKESPWTLGVLAPYRAQADLILKMVEAHSHRPKEVNITIDTVHGFQGDENNIVFAIFNPSGTGNNIGCSKFLKKDFIINVAISRAEDYLIMLVPDDDSKGLSGLPLINKLIRLAKETDESLLSVMHSSELEQRLTGNNRYFEMKSFSTAHQKINVYGKPDLPFMIRLNETSLDVHWAE